MDLKIIEYNGEKICQISLFGSNRSEEVIKYQKRIFEKFNRPNNYFLCPMPQVSYGGCLDDITRKLYEQVDYIYYYDIDSFPTRRDYFEVIYNKICDYETLVGCAFRNAHKFKPLDWRGDFISAGPPIFLSMKLYRKLQMPSLDHHGEMADTFENLSFEVKKRGYNLSIYYPKSVQGLTPEDLDTVNVPNFTASLEPDINNFGYGCDYGLFYHQFFANAKHHVRDFIKKAKEVLGET